MSTFAAFHHGGCGAFHPVVPMIFIVVAYQFGTTQEFFMALLAPECVHFFNVLCNISFGFTAIVANWAGQLLIVAYMTCYTMFVQILFVGKLLLTFRALLSS